MRKRSVSRALNARWLAAIFEDVDAEVRRETAYTANQALGVIQEETDAVLDAFPDDVAKVAGRFVRDRVAGGPTMTRGFSDLSKTFTKADWRTEAFRQQEIADHLRKELAVLRAYARPEDIAAAERSLASQEAPSA